MCTQYIERRSNMTNTEQRQYTPEDVAKWLNPPATGCGTEHIDFTQDQQDQNKAWRITGTGEKENPLVTSLNQEAIDYLFTCLISDRPEFMMRALMVADQSGIDVTKAEALS